MNIPFKQYFIVAMIPIRWGMNIPFKQYFIVVNDSYKVGYEHPI